MAEGDVVGSTGDTGAVNILGVLVGAKLGLHDGG